MSLKTIRCNWKHRKATFSKWDRLRCLNVTLEGTTEKEITQPIKYRVIRVLLLQSYMVWYDQQLMITNVSKNEISAIKGANDYSPWAQSA